MPSVRSLTSTSKVFAHPPRNLRPGGYVEIADICFPVQAHGNKLPRDSALREWSDLMCEAAKKAGRPLDSAKSYQSQLKDAGFMNVKEVIFEWPQNGWPVDEKSKELGIYIFLYCRVQTNF